MPWPDDYEIQQFTIFPHGGLSRNSGYSLTGDNLDTPDDKGLHDALTSS